MPVTSSFRNFRAFSGALRLYTVSSDSSASAVFRFTDVVGRSPQSGRARPSPLRGGAKGTEVHLLPWKMTILSAGNACWAPRPLRSILFLFEFSPLKSSLRVSVSTGAIRLSVWLFDVVVKS